MPLGGWLCLLLYSDSHMYINSTLGASRSYSFWRNIENRRINSPSGNTLQWSAGDACCAHDTICYTAPLAASEDDVSHFSGRSVFLFF